MEGILRQGCQYGVFIQSCGRPGIFKGCICIGTAGYGHDGGPWRSVFICCALCPAIKAYVVAGRLSKDSINNDLLKNVLSSKISVDVKLKTEKTIYNNERVESNKVILKDIKEDIESVDNKNVITINNDKGDHIFNIYKVSPKRYIMFRFFNQSGEDMYIEKFNNLDFLDKIKLSSQSISNDSPISIGNNIKKFINKMSVSNKNLFLSYVNTKK
jgi:hypothetical protein